MPAGEQIAFQPALAGVLGEDLHHAARRREMIVIRQGFRIPGAVGRLEHGLQPVGGGLVRAEQAEIAHRGVAPHHVAQEGAHHAGRFGVVLAGLCRPSTA